MKAPKGDAGSDARNAVVVIQFLAERNYQDLGARGDIVLEGYRTADAMRRNKVSSLRDDKDQKYGFDLQPGLVTIHFDETMNYRVMFERLGEKYELNISPIYPCEMVDQVTKFSKTSDRISHDFKAKWEGHISIDDKYMRVGGK